MSAFHLWEIFWNNFINEHLFSTNLNHVHIWCHRLLWFYFVFNFLFHCQLNSIYWFIVYTLMCDSTSHRMDVEIGGQFAGRSSPLYQGGPGTKLELPGLTGRTVTHWVKERSFSCSALWETYYWILWLLLLCVWFPRIPLVFCMLPFHFILFSFLRLSMLLPHGNVIYTMY